MRLPVHQEHDLAEAILKDTRHPAGWRNPNVGRGRSEPPMSLDEVPDWFGERVSMTTAGSYVAGVPPIDGTDAEYQAAILVALPSVTAAISKAVADKSRITVLTEGTPYDPDTELKPSDASELVAATVAGTVRALGLASANFATWDDGPVNVYDPKSPVWDRLEHATGDLDMARAAVAARMMVVGATVEDLQEVGILDDRSSLKFEELTGRPVPKKVTEPILRSLRSVVYPHEFDADPTVVSAVSDLYDSLRASNLLRKVHEAEADGGVAIAVVPPWMGYALKPVIARLNERERARKKMANLDLEMAWGRTAAKSFDEAIKGKKFKNPETGNQVTFKSLPTDEQEKIRAQWSGRNQGGGEHSDGAKDAAREVAARIVDDIDRPKGWKSGAGDELTADNREQWVADTTATSPGGSLLMGLTHADGEDPDTGARFHSDPVHKAVFDQRVRSAVSAAKKAIADGKSVVFLAEGGNGFKPYSDEDLDDPNDWGEQHSMAKALRDATKGKVEQGTWDDGAVDLTDPDAEVWGRLTKAANGDATKAKGALAVFMLGQGDSWESLTDQGWVDDSVAKAIRKATGINPKKVSDGDRERMFRMAFPGDEGEPHNEVSAIGEVYNAARQDYMLNRVRDIEKGGGVAIVAPGATHAYQLKGSFEAKQGKTAAELDLEMAWGWNARVAAKISEIMTGINPKVTSGARSVTPKLKRADPDNAMWTYTVSGSKGETYTVRVKGLPKGNVRNVSKMDVRVSCTCPFFRYQGPEHWAKVGDYLYGKPAGTAAKPNRKDPDGGNRVCKHVVAVFGRAGNFVYTPPKGKTAATTPVPDRFEPSEAGLLTRDEYLDHINKNRTTHPSSAYDFTSFKMNEGFARHHVGTVTTRRGPLSVYQSTTGMVLTDEDGRAVAVVRDGTLFHEPRAFDVPDAYLSGPHKEHIPLGIERRKQVKYIADYVTLVDNLARRNADKYPVVLRRFVSGGEPVVIRAESQPVPNKGTNLAVLDSLGRVIAVAENEWGATLISVAREARGRGLGKVLARVWHDLNPGFDSGGMTPGGSNLMSAVWADRVREFMSNGWYSQLVRDGRITRARVDEIVADLPSRAPSETQVAPTAPDPVVMSDGSSFITIYDRAVLSDPSLLDDSDDYIYGHAFLRDDPHVGTYVFSIDYDRAFADMTTRAILQLARDNGDRLFDGDGYHDIMEGVDGIPGVQRDGDYIVVTRDVFPLRALSAKERTARKAVDPYGSVKVSIMESADAKWR